MNVESREYTLKMLKLAMSENDSFKEIMKNLLEHDEKYKESMEKIQNFIIEGSSFKDAFVKLSEPKEMPCSNDLEDIIEAVIKTEAVMPDDALKKQIFSLWSKELKKGK